MRLCEVTTIKEWIEKIRYATLWEAIGCVIGMVMTIITYVLIIALLSALVLGVYALINGYGL